MAAPPSLGEIFERSVKEKDIVLFQHLVAKTGYVWGEYFHNLSPEEQLWAMANRPTVAVEGFRRQ